MSTDRPPDRHPSAPGTVLSRVADQRDRLASVSGALAQTLDPRSVATQILEAACSLLDAPQGWVVALTADGTAVEMLATVGHTAESVAPWMRVPLDVPVPMTEVVRTGKPLYHTTAVERRAAFPALAIPHGTGVDAEGSAVFPLGFEGRTTGALAVSFREARSLDDDERWFLAALAAQGSQALERARLFAEIADRDARLRFMLHASGTGTWEWDLVADTMEWSPEVSALHGLEAGATPAGLGDWLDMIHPDDRPLVRSAIRDAMRTGGACDVEFRVQRLDGSLRWAHIVGRVTRDADGHPARMLGTTRDTTDRKLAEAERDRMIQAERDAARLRDAFIGVVSHELRTPITTIFGGTRVLARRWREMEPGARDDILLDIVEESDRLYRLVEDLLVLTRVEGGTLDVGDEPIHLGRLIERVVGSERPRWPEIRFETVLAPGLPSAAGEDTSVEQVLRNLLGNAAKYGGSGSTVTVLADAEGPWVRVRVEDEGPGIDEDELDQLFELFYRSPATASTASGAGIGLFVCRQLVAAMGGSITAERRPVGGAAFIVTLPRYLDDEVP
ncbi:MAG TPA: ATP-binding protein [Candidatus Limnocylindrales bacterium]|nr:ATP-binding protein [Candidatus Limnocylindrales bacterium]